MIYAESMNQTPLEDNESVNNSSHETIQSLNTENSYNNTTTEQNNSSANKASGAIWLREYDMKNVNLSQLKGAGITDIFLHENALEDASYKSTVTSFLSQAQELGIRISIWLACFKDNGTWIDPSGKYAYNKTVSYQETVKTPYKYTYKEKVKVYYTKSVKSWYKKYYYSKGKLKYYWKYKWVKKTYYYYKYVTKTTTKYKTTYLTKYKTVTNYGYNSSFINDYTSSLINKISSYAQTSGVGGIHLDYLRYPGTAYNSTNGTASITNFVGKVDAALNAINPDIMLSAALMPETSSNAYYYGQDYTQLAQYLDVLIPMVYEGNYKANNTWIAKTTSYIVNHSAGKPVWVGILSYQSDSNVTPLSAQNLLADVQSGLDNGASGYAIFRYGLINDTFFNYSSNLTYNSTPATGTKPVEVTPTNNSSATSFSLESIKDGASRVKSFLETNQRLPNYVTLSNVQVTMSEFLNLLVKAIIEFNSGLSSNIAYKSVSEAPNPTGDALSGQLSKSEYLSLAESISAYLDSHGQAPDYATTSRGKISFSNLVYIMSKIVDFQAQENRLPNYVTLSSTSSSVSGSSKINSAYNGESLSKYLQPSSNCQSTNSTITALASKITSGLNSTWDKASAILKWVRDNLDYSFYYNTKYGAVKTLQTGSGNCVDHSHLIVALARASGIPARYVHGTCTFTSGSTYGHVWTQLLVDGTWYAADGTSYKNTLGNIANWNINTAVIKGIYADLPF